MKQTSELLLLATVDLKISSSKLFTKQASMVRVEYIYIYVRVISVPLDASEVARFTSKYPGLNGLHFNHVDIYM